MNYKNIILAAAVGLMLTGCGLYKQYETKKEIPAGVMGVRESGSSTEIVNWRQFFTDPLLQQLIEQALANNTNLASARIAVEQSEASLKAARLGYLPAFSIAPQGALSSFDLSPVTKTYSLPLQMSWDVELFGSITNKKRAAKAVLLQAQCGEEAVRSNLVSAVAQHYSMLQVLDRQLEILMQTDSLWSASLETQKSLWENGKAYSTAVNQMESSWLNVKTQIVDTRRSIRSTENSLCKLLAITPQPIARNKWGAHALSTSIALGGFSAEMLLSRPDIRLADHAMEEAFYNTQVARAAFFPSLTLSGTLGWTNNGGGVVVDPGKLLLNIMGQLTQPVFMRGQLKAGLRIAKLTQQDLLGKYTQTVIDAGNQVNEALADFQATAEKHEYYHRQVATLHDAYTGTHELMDNGKASYLEVLTAQESLLSAQLSEAMNMYNGTQALIALYIALGGGTK
ncbi:MAG: TolC family protein [Bacteroidaceae bacterium]|nr:TolC family protein [Bacteroidaceae bacterium]